MKKNETPTMKDFVNLYCSAHNITEDDLTIEDIIFLEDCFYSYATILAEAQENV